MTLEKKLLEWSNLGIDIREKFKKDAIVAGVADDYVITIPRLGEDQSRVPPEFLKAVIAQYGPIAWDLAANDDGSNAVVPGWYGPTINSLEQDWSKMHGNLWLQPPWPPHGKLGPWAKKACQSNTKFPPRYILLFCPLMVATNWWADYVDSKARVWMLSGRMTDDVTSPYFRDLALCVYGESPGYSLLKWT